MVLRKREYAADLSASKLVGANKMISALKTLSARSPQALPDQMAAFGISGQKVNHTKVYLAVILL